MNHALELNQVLITDRIAQQAFRDFWRDVEPVSDCSDREARYQLFQQFVCALKREADRQRRQFCFVDELPTELMQRILEDAMELDQPETWNLKRLHKLSLVQKSWRAITNLAVFWPTLHVGDSPLLHRRVLENNRDGPLTLVCPLKSGKSTDKWRQIVRSASPSIQRWRAFHWEGEEDSWSTICELLGQPTPQLQDLRLMSIDYGLDQVLELSGAGHLRTLWACYVPLRWDSARFQGLHVLCIEGDEGNVIPNLRDIANMLSSSPSLRELRLKGAPDATTDANVGVIRLSRLKLIVFELGRFAENYLLNRIRAHACQSLSGALTEFAQLSEPASPLSETLGSVLQRHATSLEVHYRENPSWPLMELRAGQSPTSHNFWDGVRREGLFLNIYRDSRYGNQASDWLPLANHLSYVCPIDTKFGIEKGADCDNMPLTPGLATFIEHLLNRSTHSPLSIESKSDPPTCTNVFRISRFHWEDD